MQQMSLSFGPSPQEMETASLSQNADDDGSVFVAVQTTGVFCRPACPTHFQHEHVELFKAFKDVVSAGYRPCRQCSFWELLKPLPDWAKPLMEHIEATPGYKLTPEDWHLLGITPEQASSWFKQRFGLSLTEYGKARRAAEAFVPPDAGECDPALSAVPESDDPALWKNVFATVLPEKLKRWSQKEDIALLPINTPYWPDAGRSSSTGHLPAGIYQSPHTGTEPGYGSTTD